MPRVETVFRLFVGSPSDVAEERGVVDDVVNELDLTWSKHLGIRIEVVRWETHAFPGIGDDPQGVINREIADDYDIFLGILWTKFGTPTPRHLSGTAEEFQRAYDRFRTDPNSVKIMFYFKTASVDPTEIDLDQLKAIRTFREQLGSKGTLYWTFSDREDFSALLRLHLSRQVLELATAAKATGASALLENAREALGTSSLSDPFVHAEEDDAGLLDLVQQGMEAFGEINAVLSGLTEETTIFNSRIVEHTHELEAALATSTDPRPVWRITKTIADDMEQFAARMDQDRPVYSSAVERAFGSLSGAIAISRDFELGPDEDLAIVLTNVRDLNDANQNSRVSITFFRNSVANQPRISTPINRAKRKLVAALDSFINEMDRSLNLGRTVEQEIEALINNESDPAKRETSTRGIAGESISHSVSPTASTPAAAPPKRSRTRNTPDDPKSERKRGGSGKTKQR